MTNPVFNNSAVFGDPRARGNRGRAQQPTAQPGVYGATATGPVIEAQSLEQMYGAPAATTRCSAARASSSPPPSAVPLTKAKVRAGNASSRS